MANPIYHSQYTAAQIEAAIGHGPRVNNSGFWETWNVSTMAYENTGVGAGVQPPTVVTQASQMTNHGYVYIYNGSEDGYIPGYWYYWNGTAWIAGGAYQVAATDPTLSVSGGVADAKIVGNALNASYAQLDWTPGLTLGKYIKFADGTEGSSNKYCRTTLWNGYHYRIAIEIADPTYTVSVAYFAKGGSVSTGAGFLGHDAYTSGMHYIPMKAYLFGLSFRRADQATMTSSDLTAISAALKAYGITDNTLTQKGIAADAQVTGDDLRLLTATKAQAITTRYSGNPANFSAAAASDIASLIINITPARSGSGTPAPGNVREISGRTGCSLNRSGSDASSPTTKTYSWEDTAGTVYYAELDVILGILTVYPCSKVLQKSSWSWQTWTPSGASYTYFCRTVDAMKTYPDRIMCDTFQKTTSQSSAPNYSWYNAPDRYYNFNFKMENGTTLSQFKSFLDNNDVYVLYQSGAPSVYHLDPYVFRALSGENNIWSDAGSVSVDVVTEIKQYVSSMVSGLQDGIDNLSQRADDLDAHAEYLLDADYRYLYNGNLIDYENDIATTYARYEIARWPISEINLDYNVRVRFDSITTDYSASTGLQVFYYDSSGLHSIGSILTSPGSKSYTIPSTATQVRLYAVFNYGSGSSVVGYKTTIKGIVVYNNYWGCSWLANRNFRVSPKTIYPKVPEYYYEDSYIAGKLSTVRTLAEKSAIGDNFVFVTDCHWARNAGISPELINYILRRTNVRFVVDGGDTYDHESSKAAARTAIVDFTSAFNSLKDNLYHVIGNHEYNNAGGTTSSVQLNSAEIYTLLCKSREQTFVSTNGADYCVDNKAQKIRYFFIGCDYAGNVTEATNTWFTAQLAAVPDGWNVMVFSHATFGADEHISVTLNTIVGMLEAAKASQRINVIGILGGHVHKDLSETSSGGILVVSTTCDTIPNNSTTRIAGTITEQAFDIVTLDLTNRKLYMTRIGYGSDREFSF